ncbi:hypothetical protein Dimus_035851 [Dionaea muscipula]
MSGNPWILKKSKPRPKPEPDMEVANEDTKRELAPPLPPAQSPTAAAVGRHENGFGGGGARSLVSKFGNNTEAGSNSGRSPDLEEQEETLIAVIEHRTKEVEHLRRRVTYLKEVEFQQQSASPIQNLGDPSQYKPNSRPKLVIPEIPLPGPSQPT